MIEIGNVSKTYETGNKAIKDVSLTIDDGKFMFTIGRGGSGKSTLMKLLLKGLEPTRGHIVANDMDLGGMSRRYVPRHCRRLGVVFQDFKFLKDRTVLENAALIQRVAGISPRIIRETVPEMLRLVELSSRYKAYLRQLSGDEQQRVVIVRVLINDPEVLPTGESTDSPDSSNIHEIIRPLEETNQRGTTVIMITYSQEMVDEMSKRIIAMEWGSVISDMDGCYQGAVAAVLESLWACLFRREGK